MQLEFDLARRERCALRTVKLLEEIGVPDLQRWVIRLLAEHEDAQWLDTEDRIVTLRISYRAAVRWLRQNFREFRELCDDHSPLLRAVKAWEVRGIVQTFGSGPTVIALNEGRLNAWHAAEESRIQEALRAWAGGTSRDFAGPSGTARDAMSERVNEDLIHSFIHSLPPQIFDRQLKGRELLAVIDAWWGSADGDEQSRILRRDAIGAILAARQTAGGDPQRYAQQCLLRGVIRKWQDAAAAFLSACDRDAAGAAIIASSRKRKKPKNILRELRESQHDQAHDDAR